MAEKHEQLKSELGSKYEFIEHQYAEIENTPVSIEKFKDMLENGTTKGKITEPNGIESKEFGELDGKALWSLQAGDIRIDLLIWQYDMQEQSEFGNGIGFEIYSNKFSRTNEEHFYMELAGQHYKYSDLDIDKVNSVADIETQMFEILDKVVQENGLKYVTEEISKPPTQQELYEQAVADDKFYLRNDGQIEQLYYNPDGYGGEGQYVSDNYSYQDVLDAAAQANGSVKKFFEHFYGVSKQYLTDNDGSDEFRAEDSRFNGNDHDLMGCTEETASGLAEFAREQEKLETIDLNKKKQPDIKTGDFIDYDNKRWHVDYVGADTIQLTNINPLDNNKEIRASRWKDHIKEYTVVDKSEVDMSTLIPQTAGRKLSFDGQNQNIELPVIDMKKLETVLRNSGLFSNEEVQAIWHTVWDYSGDWLKVSDERFMKSAAVEKETGKQPSKQKPSLADRIEKGKEKVREADKNKGEPDKPKNKKKGVDIDG